MTTISTLEGITAKEIVTAFNLSFSDYFVPMQLTSEQLSVKFKSENFNPDYSVGAFNNGRLVGFILHFYDKVNGEIIIYNGGTGVIKEFRGQGLTQKMYAFIIPQLKKAGISHIVLEVLTQNIQAIKSYEKAGFLHNRILKCFKGQASVSNVNGEIDIEEALLYDWNRLILFWDFEPTWQNSIQTLENLKIENVLIYAKIANMIAGYLVYNPKTKRIQQIAVDKKFRRKGIASAMVRYLIQKHGTNLVLINVESGNLEITRFLEKIGLQNHIDQIELKCELKNYQE